jgi:hypothetical protein
MNSDGSLQAPPHCFMEMQGLFGVASIRRLCGKGAEMARNDLLAPVRELTDAVEVAIRACRKVILSDDLNPTDDTEETASHLLHSLKVAHEELLEQELRYGRMATL